MKDPIPSSDENDDAVWKLLGQAPPRRASSRFVDDTVRSAELLAENEPAWTGLRFPLVWAAAAALVMAFVLFTQQAEQPSQVALVDADARLVEIREFAEVEMLEAAVDHLDEFSDLELVTLIGF